MTRLGEELKEKLYLTWLLVAETREVAVALREMESAGRRAGACVQQGRADLRMSEWKEGAECSWGPPVSFPSGNDNSS